MTKSTGAGNGTKPADRKLRVLVVEDHADTLRAFTRLLELYGYEVVAAESAAKAIELAARFTPDIVLADAQLPDGTGWTLFPLLKETYPHLVGIAVTAHGFPHHVQESRAAGFCEHLTKPVNAVELKNAIDYCLTQRPAAA